MTIPHIGKAWLRDFLPRFLFCLLGNVILGVGVALTKLAGFGNDPFNGSCFAISGFFGIPYTVCLPVFNCFCFLFEILWGRKYIGIGTFINWFLACYVVEFTLFLFGESGAEAVAANLWTRVVFLALGMVGCSLGVAIYQLCNAGVAPYDALPLMVVDRFPKIPYFWVRMFFDCFCVATILIFRGTFGIGTVIVAFGLGPIIHFFTFLIRRFLPKPKRV